MKFEIEVDIPAGYEPTGEFRTPRSGDTFMTNGGQVMTTKSNNWSDNKIILRKIRQWRDPVLPADWGKHARFSDDGKVWKEGLLYGYQKEDVDDDLCWAEELGHGYKFCQVTDD